jgi:acetolactate synthase small subunit
MNNDISKGVVYTITEDVYGYAKKDRVIKARKGAKARVISISDSVCIVELEGTKERITVKTGTLISFT